MHKMVFPMFAHHILLKNKAIGRNLFFCLLLRERNMLLDPLHRKFPVILTFCRLQRALMIDFMSMSMMMMMTVLVSMSMSVTVTVMVIMLSELNNDQLASRSQTVINLLQHCIHIAQMMIRGTHEHHIHFALELWRQFQVFLSIQAKEHIIRANELLVRLINERRRDIQPNIAAVGTHCVDKLWNEYTSSGSHLDHDSIA
mmetsp:Transcript_45931/g.73547  ORF Transcript_45931/g.73547 Transcript_45931/m.73547 type:complete len:200 (+) Transcript_45931:82-681(+)